MKKKYYLILLFIIFIISVGFIFYKNSIKNLKIGNNKNSQEIVDYILNLSSYEAEVTVNITSNKNSNKYILKQKYQKDKESKNLYLNVEEEIGKVDCVKLEKIRISEKGSYAWYNFMYNNMFSCFNKLLHKNKCTSK